MNNSRLERLAPLTGAVSVVLMIVGTVLIGAYDYLPPADDIVDFLNANYTRASIGGYLGTISAFFLIWFAGSVHSALRERESGAGRLSMVAFGGGVAGGISLAATFAVMTAAAQRAGVGGGISPEEAVTLSDLWGALGGLVVPVTLAAFIGATAIVSLRAGVFPTWFGWASGLIALGLLSPLGYLFAALSPLWVLVVSIWLYARGASTALAPATGDTGIGTR